MKTTGIKRLTASMLFASIGTAVAPMAFAAGDVDIDNDGLIEISTLEQLNLMRYDLAGTSLNGDSTGCPATGCHGYELVADLDFDTNGNGVFDSGDLFWNNGKGWVPVGWVSSYSKYPFTATFEGNSHAIRNLRIDNLKGDGVGLFSSTNAASIQNLSFIKPVITIDYSYNKKSAGAIAGQMIDSSINNVSVEDIVLSGYSYSGSIAGTFKSDLPVSGVHATGKLDGASRVAGLFGTLRGMSGPNSLSVNDISFAGSVYAEYTASGIAGSIISTELLDCSVTGSVETSGHNTAGLASLLLDSTISQCHVNAAVKVRDDDPDGTVSYFTGGLFSEMGSSTVEETSFVGEVWTPGNHAGGIAGAVTGTIIIRDVSIISDIYSANCCVGGLFGILYSKVNDPLASIDVDRVVIAGDISSRDLTSVAGIFGGSWVSNEEVQSTLHIGSVYWDSELSGVYSSGASGIDVGGEGKSTFELQCPTMPGDVTCDADLYAGWDEAIWDFGTSSDYPVLR